MTPAAREQRAKAANKTRAKKRLQEYEVEEPPDKHDDFCKGIHFL